MSMQNNFSSFDFNKYADGLIPAIVQDATTSKVLMLGFMNQEAFNKTIETKLVTFLAEVNNVYGQKERSVKITCTWWN